METEDTRPGPPLLPGGPAGYFPPDTPTAPAAPASSSTAELREARTEQASRKYAAAVVSGDQKTADAVLAGEKHNQFMDGVDDMRATQAANGVGKLDFNYDGIVAAHGDMLEGLNVRAEQATAVKTEAAAAAAAADGMDDGRATLVQNANCLVEMMTAARFDTSSLTGASELADSFTADDAAALEEHCEELERTAVQVAGTATAALDGVQESRDHIVSTYGQLAEGVQSTGVSGKALEGAGA